LWSWGSNQYGQLGNGTAADSLTPNKIMDDIIFVSAGTKHSMAIKSNGELWAFGHNNFGQLGNEFNLLGTQTVDRNTPFMRSNPIFITDSVTTVVAGDDITLAVKTDGSLWAWGWNSGGRLADGTYTSRTTPTKIMEGVKFY
jgi:alpha-tubulin suppressor-like RCC1 family protein